MHAPPAVLASEGGTLVTYGAMSMQPLTLPTGLLIFKGIQFKGFWLSGGWAKKAGPEARGRLLDQLAQYNLKGQLHPPK
jgi:trans-2-enoyl-CoA reductase